VVPKSGERRLRGGANLIERMSIMEAGPCLEPANPEAIVVSVKSSDRGRAEVAELRALVDAIAGDTPKSKSEVQELRQYVRALGAPKRTPRDETAAIRAEATRLGGPPPEADLRAELARLEAEESRRLADELRVRSLADQVAVASSSSSSLSWQEQVAANEGHDARQAAIHRAEVAEAERHAAELRHPPAASASAPRSPMSLLCGGGVAS
jgi:hypothetical protein